MRNRWLWVVIIAAIFSCFSYLVLANDTDHKYYNKTLYKYSERLVRIEVLLEEIRDDIKLLLKE